METGQGQYVIHFRIDGDPEDMLCTIGVDLDQIGTGINVNAGQTELINAWQDNLSDFQDDQYYISEVEIQEQTALGVLSASVFTHVNGTVSGDPLLQNTAYLIHKLTDGVGRGKFGRMYIPGVPASFVNDVGLVAPSTVASFDNALQQFLDDFAVWTADAFVVNHKAGSPLSPASLITTLNCDPVCGSQRRRLRH